MTLDKHAWSAWQRDERGAIAIAFSLAIVALLGAVSLAVDLGRSYSASSKMIAALDAAAIAGAKLLGNDDATDTEVRAIAEAYFNQNLQEIGLGAYTLDKFEVVMNKSDSSVSVTAGIGVPTSFANVVGVDKVAIERTSTVVFKMKKVELALVLDITGSMNTNNKLQSMQAAAKDVVDSLLGGDNVITGNVKIALAPYAASINAGGYAATASGGASADSCVVERTGANAAFDAGPGAGNYANVAGAAPFGNYSCVATSVQPLTTDKTLLKNSIDGFVANGATAGHIGTAWGWYLLSPAWASVWPSASQPKAYGQTDVVKNIIIMTDGEFNTAYINGPGAASQGSDSYAAFQALCTNMKAQDIMVYTVGFDLIDPLALQQLEMCASGAGNFFAAVSGNELKNAFQQIVAKLNSLRITK